MAATTSDWGGLLDDLDRTLVQLAQERVVLELGQLVDLRDLRELGRAHGSDLLGLLEQLADVLDGEDVLDVGLTQDAAGREAVGGGTHTLSHSATPCLGASAKSLTLASRRFAFSIVTASTRPDGRRREKSYARFDDFDDERGHVCTHASQHSRATSAGSTI